MRCDSHFIIVVCVNKSMSKAVRDDDYSDPKIYLENTKRRRRSCVFFRKDCNNSIYIRRRHITTTHMSSSSPLLHADDDSHVMRMHNVSTPTSDVDVLLHNLDDSLFETYHKMLTTQGITSGGVPIVRARRKNNKSSPPTSPLSSSSSFSNARVLQMTPPVYADLGETIERTTSDFHAALTACYMAEDRALLLGGTPESLREERAAIHKLIDITIDLSSMLLYRKIVTRDNMYARDANIRASLEDITNEKREILAQMMDADDKKATLTQDIARRFRDLSEEALGLVESFGDSWPDRVNYIVVTPPLVKSNDSAKDVAQKQKMVERRRRVTKALAKKKRLVAKSG